MARRRNNASNGRAIVGEYVNLENRLVLLAWLNSLFGYSNNRDLLADMNELCREIYPDFDRLERWTKDARRRRVLRAVAVMWHISLYFAYNRPLKKLVPVKGSRGKLKKMVKVNERHIIRERWIENWRNVEEDGRKKHRIVMRLGIWSDDYTKAISSTVLFLLCDIEHECDQRLFLRLQRETWLEENRSVTKLIEWGGWRSNDRARNEQYLARALARYVEIGYLQEVTFLPDTEQYHLVKHPDHYFPRGLPSEGKGEVLLRPRLGGGHRREQD